MAHLYIHNTYSQELGWYIVIYFVFYVSLVIVLLNWIDMCHAITTLLRIVRLFPILSYSRCVILQSSYQDVYARGDFSYTLPMNTERLRNHCTPVDTTYTYVFLMSPFSLICNNGNTRVTTKHNLLNGNWTTSLDFPVTTKFNFHTYTIFIASEGGFATRYILNYWPTGV